MAGYSKVGLAARWSLTLAPMLVGVLALIASGAPAAWAGPAQEEYRLQIPDPRGGGGSSSPGDARSQLAGGSGPGSSSSPVGGTSDPSSSGVGSSGSGSPGSGFSGGFGGSGNGGSFSEGTDPGGDEALLAKARQGPPTSSGLLAATGSAMGKTPIGLALIAAVLLITLAGLVAIRRSRRARVSGGWD